MSGHNIQSNAIRAGKILHPIAGSINLQTGLKQNIIDKYLNYFIRSPETNFSKYFEY